MAAEEVYPQLEEGMLPQLGLPPSLHIVNTDAKASDGSARGGNIVQLFRRFADTTGAGFNIYLGRKLQSVALRAH